jgi:hypothetical protein
MTTDSQAGPGDERQGHCHRSDRSVYLRFGAMIATSTVVMYLITYLNVVSVSHIHFSEERVYMALTMGAGMGVVMMAWMWGMYANRRWNVGIIVVSVVLGVVATFLSQSQLLVEDANYMRGMIPHHSIAILTSERAGITDVRVRELADKGAAPGDRRDGVAAGRHCRQRRSDNGRGGRSAAYSVVRGESIALPVLTPFRGVSSALLLSARQEAANDESNKRRQHDGKYLPSFEQHASAIGDDEPRCQGDCDEAVRANVGLLAQEQRAASLREIHAAQRSDGACSTARDGCRAGG